MEYAYRFRIYPNSEQENQILRTLGCCRYVFNYYLAMRRETYEKTDKTLNYCDCSKDMTVLKKSLEWLREVDTTALQSSLRDLDSAFKNFFRRMWYSKQVVTVDRFFPSSQLCSVCGAQWSGTKDLSVREWICPECSTVHDRDCNAAKNILNERPCLLAQPENTVGRDTPEPNARGDYVTPRTMQAAVSEPRIPQL